MTSQNERVSRILIRLFVYFLVLVAGLCLLTGVFCWLVGWRSFYQYGVTLSTIGMFVAALGGLGVMGGWGGTRSFQYQYGSSSSSRSISERAAQDLKDLFGSYRFAYLACAVGVTAFLGGLALAGVL